MAVDTTAMNGHANGSIHRGAKASRSRRRGRSTLFGWALDKVLKVAVWYTIITLAFRCPAAQTDLTNDSPKICRPSLQLRDFATPYTQPYYDRFVSPYVQQVEPYVLQVKSNVYSPGLAVYQKYGAPRVADAQDFSQRQWQKSIKPQLDVLQKETGKQYEAHVGPHVKKAQDVVQPYYDSVKESTDGFWQYELEPIYRRTKPYAEKIYLQGQDFAVKTALPQVQFVGSSVWTVLSRQLWPRVRILYGENVEPQLLRITERLGRYKDGRKLEADIKSMETSSKLADASSSASSIASSASSTAKEISETPSAAASSASQATTASSASTSDTTSEFRQELKNWEEISAKAVEEGSEDLKERIQDIADLQMKSATSVGGALVIQLEETVESALNSVKASVQQIVRSLPADADEKRTEEANEELIVSIRAAGQRIKQRAQAVRDWRRTKDAETNDIIDKALQSTLETIEHIRDLRLTEIGRKYASSSLPHKEWSRYNDLKKATQSWRKGVKSSAQNHQGIFNARSASEDAEQQAMAMAEDAAKELGRLKEVGKWKIAADEDSDDFSTRYVPPPVRKAKEEILEKVAEASQAILGGQESASSFDASSLIGEASESASSVASAVSEAVLGSQSGLSDSATDAASSLSSAILGESSLSDTVTDVVSSISSAVVGESSFTDTIAAAASSASSAILDESSLVDSATEAESAASAAILGSEKPVKSVGSKLASMLSSQSKNAESAASGIQESASKVSASASSVSNTVGSQASSASSAISGKLPSSEAIIDSASSAASSATAKAKKVMGGAMAQVLVEAREPIMDEVEDQAESLSENLQSIVSVAGDKASELTRAVQDALKRATATQGTVGSVTSVASEQFESAMAAASGVLFGTQKGVIEEGSSVARAQYESAVTAASHAIYGTPITAAPLAQASSVYDVAMSEASKHYEQVKSRISKQISGPTKPIHEQMLSSAGSAYSAAIIAASERLHEATRTQNPYESISSLAASRLSEAVAAASSQYRSAKIAVGAEPTPVHQQYLASAQKAYYQALGVAHGRYSEFVDAASDLLTPAPTPTSIAVLSEKFDQAISGARANYNVYMSVAESQYSAILQMASSAAKKKGSKTVEATSLKQIQQQLSEASSEASSRLSAASSKASVAVYGEEPAFTDVVASKASENWEALIAKASEQVYGAPLPFTDSIISRATDIASQATDAAAAQWDAVSGLFAELVSGKEPDFTESVYSRLQFAYSTGAPALASQASSVASVAYESAMSAVSAVFVPPTQVPSILEQMQDQLDAAVDAVSAQVYGTPKGAFEKATEAAASAYTEAASQVSQAVYGKDANYIESVQSNIAEIGASASKAVNAALYGSPTNTLQAASSAAASVYSSIASQASEQASAASAAVSRAIYGEEQTYLEGVQSKLSVAMASASSRISELSVQASKAAGDGAEYLSSAAEQVASTVSSAAEEAASTVSSVVSEATDRVRDEL